MSASTRRFAAVILGTTFLLCAAPAAASVGFVDLPRLIAIHPLHAILSQYDREIVALRSTQRILALRSPALSAQAGAHAIQSDAATGALRADAIGNRDVSRDRAQENAALDSLLRQRQDPARGAAVSTSQLVAETNANLRAYRASLLERMERAYAARAQQLREKEATLVFDLQRRDAGRRLLLRLKIDDLHSTASRRASLQSQLRQLYAIEMRTVAQARMADNGALAAYRIQLERNAGADEDVLDAQLRAKAQANYGMLRRIFNERAASESLPSVSQLVALRSGRSAVNPDSSISGAMRTASNDLSLRFAHAADADSHSQRDTSSQLHTLQADRVALYREIVAQIRSVAFSLARERHLRRVDFSRADAEHGAVDLTPAIISQLRIDWH
ncbi:MAG: hypothetical protein JOZ77_11480 [Candidatus Eremiobacteraeota bacterium]|nr:hypothetical protein [Candidatus Eremiobacteraeota bacterium]